jgi:hypothetical protein
VTEVACDACESALFPTALPPGGYADGDRERFADALDARLRRRIESVSDGVCPECAGEVDATVESAGEAPDDEATAVREVAGDSPPVQATFDCETCELTLRCPVTLTMLSHPAVVAFYHDHGEDVRERPVWNVGAEWREHLVSRVPWCVVVSARIDGEDLFLYVARDGAVVDYRRQTDPTTDAVESDGRSDDDPDDPDGGDRRPVEAAGATDARAADGPGADENGDLDHASAGDGATA